MPYFRNGCDTMSWQDILKDKTFPLPGEKPIIDILLQNYRVHIIMLEKMEKDFKQLKQHMNETPTQ